MALTQGLCTYFLDEAASGTTPTEAGDDGTGTAYPLTLDYSLNMAYTEDGSGNRGLDSQATNGNQRAYADINDTSDKVRDALDGTTQFSWEIVYSHSDAASGTGRIWVINQTSGQNARVGFTSNDTTNLDFYFNGALMLSGVGSVSTRTHLVVTVDTTQSSGSRVKVYRNGTLLTAGSDYTLDSEPSASATLSFGSSSQLIMFNRENGGTWARSVVGVMYYAAVYDSALSASEVSGNYTALNADDDTQGFGGGGATGSKVSPFSLLRGLL